MGKTRAAQKTNELKNRALNRKKEPSLRHNPNKADIAVVNENTQLLQPQEYRTFENK